MVMATIPLADVKARLSAVLDEVRDTHERVVITRNGRPEAVILSVAGLPPVQAGAIIASPGRSCRFDRSTAIAAAGGSDANRDRGAKPHARPVMICRDLGAGHRRSLDAGSASRLDASIHPARPCRPDG